MSDVIQVVTTASSAVEANQIARTLVELRLAACVQVVGPITSTYRWQGQIEASQEWQCVAKTRRSHYGAVERTIARIHSYEVPEILALPIAAGGAAYLEWLDGQLCDPTGPEIA